MRERLLIRHFLQRFIDNDLIAPDADRHEVLALVCAALTAPGLFFTVMLLPKYHLMYLPSGLTAVAALDDRFLYIASSMIVMALVALSAWDALALDARDAAILGPLPIPRGMVIRSKLVAVVLFATGFAAALNLVPSVLYPFVLLGRLPVGLFGLMTLMTAHAIATVAAGAFGFVSVLALREVVRAALGANGFARVSTIVQATLVVFCATMLLRLPGAHSDVARSWLGRGELNPYWIPPLWFVGLHETLAGSVIDGLPRLPVRGRIRVSEDEATTLYRSHRILFEDLAGVAIAVLCLVVVVAVAAYVWNSRRPQAVAVRQTRHRLVGAPFAWVAQRLIVRRPMVQAGFFFTLQSLARSAPHRLAMATSVAVGLAAATVSLRGVNLRQTGDVLSIPVALFVVQTGLILSVLLGFRHAVRIPAELRANWMFHLSWSGDERPYFSGVKRAGVTALVLPLLLVLVLGYAWAIGARLAFAHFVFGLFLALLVLEWLWLGLRKLPFASSYVPAANLKVLGPLCVLAFLVTAYGVAWLERWALGSSRGIEAFLLGTATVIVMIRAADCWRRRARVAIELNELPAPPTQRLELVE